MNQQWQQPPQWQPQPPQWQPQPPQWQPPQPKPGAPTWLIAALIGTPVVALLFCGGLVCIGAAADSKKSRASAPAATTKPAPKPACFTGDNCYLRTIGSDRAVPVFGSEDAMSKATKAAARKDVLGFASQIAFSVDDGTPVRVIGRGFEKAEIRIQSGQHFGRSGWVGTDSLKP
jgi:hypothetical protein